MGCGSLSHLAAQCAPTHTTGSLAFEIPVVDCPNWDTSWTYNFQEIDNAVSNIALSTPVVAALGISTAATQTQLTALQSVVSTIGSSTSTLNANKVPYTGSTTDVNLGTHTLVNTSSMTASAFFGDGSHLTGIPSTTSITSTYVPYTGATTNVTLGARSLSATGLLVPTNTTIDLNSASSGNYFMKNSGNTIQFFTNGSAASNLALSMDVNQNLGISTGQPQSLIHAVKPGTAEIMAETTANSGIAGMKSKGLNTVGTAFVWDMGHGHGLNNGSWELYYEGFGDVIISSPSGSVYVPNGSLSLGIAGANDRLDVWAPGTTTRPGISVEDTTALATGTGGGIAFYGAYTGSSQTQAALIKAQKDNSTDGQFGFNMGFYTRPNGGTLFEGARMVSDGSFQTNVELIIANNSGGNPGTTYALGLFTYVTATNQSCDTTCNGASDTCLGSFTSAGARQACSVAGANNRCLCLAFIR